MMDFFVWLEHTPIANAIRETRWMYATFETSHYIGLALLVGGIMLIDLRVLGFARTLPLKSMIGLLPFVWVGFLINVLSGSMLFIYGATSFGFNHAFWLKMTFMVFAGLERARVRPLGAPLEGRLGRRRSAADVREGVRDAVVRALALRRDDGPVDGVHLTPRASRRRVP